MYCIHVWHMLTQYVLQLCLDMHTGMYVYMHVYYCVFAINIFSIFLFVCIIL